MEESGGWTAYQIIIAIATTAGSLAALGGLTLGFLKWYDRRKTEAYRLSARVAARSLLCARVELFEIYSLLKADPDSQWLKDFLRRQLFQLDKALDDLEDIIPTDVRDIRDLRPRRSITIDELVDEGKDES